jgi:pilus assembly protein CpaF
MGAVETVVGEVRELIRRTGVDPLKDESTIRQLVRDAIAEWRSPSLSGISAPAPPHLE